MSLCLGRGTGPGGHFAHLLASIPIFLTLSFQPSANIVDWSVFKIVFTLRVSVFARWSVRRNILRSFRRKDLGLDKYLYLNKLLMEEIKNERCKDLL